MIELVPLEHREEELTHGHVVGVGRRDHHRHLQLLKERLEALRLVPRRPVQLQHRVGPPLGTVLVQLTHQVPHVLREGRRVRIRLHQAEVELAVAVQGRDHRDPGYDWM